MGLCAKGEQGNPHGKGQARHLGGRGKEGGDGRRRALIYVGRPHVERHRADLEGQTRQHEHHAEQRAHRQSGAKGAAMQRFANAKVTGGACKAVNEADAEQQNAAGKGTQHEIFKARLGAALVVAQEAGQHISGQRVQLQTDIQRQQVGGRYHHAHAERGKQHQQRIFGPHRAHPFEKGRRDQQGGNGGAIDQQLGIGGETILGILAKEGTGLMAHHPTGEGRHGEKGSDTQRQHAGAGNEARGLVAPPSRHQQQQQAGKAENVLGDNQAK